MKKHRIKQKFEMKVNRRQVLKAGLAGGTALMLPWKFGLPKAFAVPLPASVSLNDPASVDKFTTNVPDALMPAFKYTPVGNSGNSRNYRVSISQANHQWGTMGGPNNPLTTSIYGYGGTWPGKTFEVQSGKPVQIQWENNLAPNGGHLLPADTSLHWCYSLPGYTQYSIANDGVPIVTHVHGHHSQYRSDGNPEEFFTYRWKVKGPHFRGKTSIYHNDQPAGNLWYHDHALGITRLNVYAGMAGFYFVRDDMDTGLPGNPLGLPAWPYEKAYAIQDRMFSEPDAQGYAPLFYPAFPEDPAYADFIDDEGAILPPGIFSDGGPTALAEFFGDHMVVNGKAWPKEDVLPRNYRMHLLNGCDSRFMVIRFRPIPAGEIDFANAGAAIPFFVIGSDQGLAEIATMTDTLVFEPGGRYDIVFDFKGLQGMRIIMENMGWDAPFNGAFGRDDPEADLFDESLTDRIMAFDVAGEPNIDDAFDQANIDNPSTVPSATTTRQVALFEGKDEFGRLQPLLGTNTGTPAAPVWSAIAWHSPTTENPALNATEEWEIYNFTGDAHPIHLHLVHFKILGRNAITFDSDDGDPGQQVLQHNGMFGIAPVISNVTVIAGNVDPGPEYVENAPKDMVTALPEQVTRIKAKFDKPGRFVWHCHILSHEDHEMMRVLHVGGGA